MQYPDTFWIPISVLPQQIRIGIHDDLSSIQILFGFQSPSYPSKSGLGFMMTYPVSRYFLNSNLRPTPTNQDWDSWWLIQYPDTFWIPISVLPQQIRIGIHDDLSSIQILFEFQSPSYPNKSGLGFMMTYPVSRYFLNSNLRPTPTNQDWDSWWLMQYPDTFWIPISVPPQQIRIGIHDDLSSIQILFEFQSPSYPNKSGLGFMMTYPVSRYFLDSNLRPTPAHDDLTNQDWDSWWLIQYPDTFWIPISVLPQQIRIGIHDDLSSIQILFEFQSPSYPNKSGLGFMMTYPVSRYFLNSNLRPTPTNQDWDSWWLIQYPDTFWIPISVLPQQIRIGIHDDLSSIQILFEFQSPSHPNKSGLGFMMTYPVSRYFLNSNLRPTPTRFYHGVQVYHPLAMAHAVYTVYVDMANTSAPQKLMPWLLWLCQTLIACWFQHSPTAF